MWVPLRARPLLTNGASGPAASDQTFFMYADPPVLRGTGVRGRTYRISGGRTDEAASSCADGDASAGLRKGVELIAHLYQTS